MQTLSYLLPQKSKVSLPMVAVVGALHLGFIYALLVGIDVIPPPSFIPHTGIKIIPEKTTSEPRPADPTIKISTHITGPVVPEPWVKADSSNDKTGSGISTIIGDGSSEKTSILPVAATAITWTHIIPDYPSIDRRLGHAGLVKLALVIDDQGNVADVSVVQSSGYDGLDQAAVAWVKAHWRYHPATRDGKPVASNMQAQVTFRLTQG